MVLLLAQLANIYTWRSRAVTRVGFCIVGIIAADTGFRLSDIAGSGAAEVVFSVRSLQANSGERSPVRTA